MPFHNAAIRRTSWLLIGLTLLFIIVWASPGFGVLQSVDIMPLSLHVAMETFAIVIAMLIFAVTWNTYDADRATNILVLACGFLAVGLLDFGHMFSFRGMPDLVTPSGPEKGIQFWLSGRLISALVLLAVAMSAWRPLFNPRNRYALLFASLATTGVFYWLVLFHGQDWPRTFVEGRGLTSFKFGVEYAVIVILSFAALLLHRQWMQGEKGHFDAVNLFAACYIAVLSELCFVLYSAVSDVFNMLGHIYKVIAYIFIYRAVFIDSVREPFVRLKETRDELMVSRMMLRSVIDNAPIRIFWKDKEGRFLGANEPVLRDLALSSEQQILGNDVFAHFPKEKAEAFQADDREVMATGKPKLNIEESIQTPDGRTAWFLTNKVSLRGCNGEVIGLLGACVEITELRKTEQRLEEVVKQLRELTVTREKAREAERKRIAQDLHDELGQMLTCLRMEAFMLGKQHGGGNPELALRVKNIIEHIDATIQVVRDVSSQLRPAVLDDGITSALEWQVGQFNKRSGIPCALSVDAKDPDLDPGQATTIFRIVQESLTNVMRHSSAQHASVRLAQEGDHCLLEIQDDGAGFDPGKPGKKTFGLMGIRERAMVLDGKIDIESAPQQGTKISIRIPLADKGEKHD